MSVHGFALFCLLGFLLPALLIAWLDRPRSRARHRTRRPAGS
jgi:hypothetical protein